MIDQGTIRAMIKRFTGPLAALIPTGTASATTYLRGDGAWADPFPNGQLVARVNFNGTGVVAIRSAANVASITDNGTGDYTVNFSTALADANYVAVVMGTAEASAAPVAIALPYIISQTASALRFRFSNPADGTARADKLIANVAVFR